MKADWDNSGNFHVPMPALSETMHTLLKPSVARAQCEAVAKKVAQRYTYQHAAEALVQVFAERSQRTPDDLRTESPLFPPIFCRRYDPDTGTMGSGVYRLGMNRYDSLETAVAEVLTEQHTPTEVESVLKHFRGETSG